MAIFCLIMGAIFGASALALLQAFTGYSAARDLKKALAKSTALQLRWAQLQAANDNFKRECEKELGK